MMKPSSTSWSGSSGRSGWVGRWAILWVVLVICAMAGAASAQQDVDADLVPDAFDNCRTDPNGPGQQSNQVDSDLDGYGNVCDLDYNGDCVTTTLDFPIFFDCFIGINIIEDCDHNGDGLVTTIDFAPFLAAFQGARPACGPSGLACAGTVPCVP